MHIILRKNKTIVRPYISFGYSEIPVFIVYAMIQYGITVELIVKSFTNIDSRCYYDDFKSIIFDYVNKNPDKVWEDIDMYFDIISEKCNLISNSVHILIRMDFTVKLVNHVISLLD
jgi:hypothetical protein